MARTAGQKRGILNKLGWNRLVMAVLILKTLKLRNTEADINTALTNQ